MGIHSINLTERNEKVYKRFFGEKGRNGRFSSWINDQLNTGFNLSGIEALKQILKENREDIEKKEERNIKLVEKLRLLIDKEQFDSKKHV